MIMTISLNTPVERLAAQWHNAKTGLYDDVVQTPAEQGCVLEGNEFKLDGRTYSIVRRTYPFRLSGDDYTCFDVIRTDRPAFSLKPKKFMAFFRDLWSGRNLDNDTEIKNALRKFGLTPVLHPEQRYALEEKDAIFSGLGCTNLDVIAKKDPNFLQAKAAWARVKDVPVSSCDAFEYGFMRFRQKCPVSNDYLTKETAVKVTLQDGKILLMSREGIRHALQCTDGDDRAITHDMMINATFEEATSPQGALSRAYKTFFRNLDFRRPDYTRIYHNSFYSRHPDLRRY